MPVAAKDSKPTSSSAAPQGTGKATASPQNPSDPLRGKGSYDAQRKVVAPPQGDAGTSPVKSTNKDVNGKTPQQLQAELANLVKKYRGLIKSERDSANFQRDNEQHFFDDQNFIEKSAAFLNGPKKIDPKRWNAVIKLVESAETALGAGDLARAIETYGRAKDLANQFYGEGNRYLMGYAKDMEFNAKVDKLVGDIAFASAAYIASAGIAGPAIVAAGGGTTLAVLGGGLTAGAVVGAGNAAGNALGQEFAYGQVDWDKVAGSGVKGFKDGLIDGGFAVLGKSAAVNKFFGLGLGGVANAASSWLVQAIADVSKRAVKGAALATLKSMLKQVGDLALDKDLQKLWQTDPAAAFLQFRTKLEQDVVAGIVGEELSGISGGGKGPMTVTDGLHVVGNKTVSIVAGKILVPDVVPGAASPGSTNGDVGAQQVGQDQAGSSKAKGNGKEETGPSAPPTADNKPAAVTTRLGFVAQLVAQNPLQYALFMSHKAGKGLEAAFTRPADAITRAEAAEFVMRALATSVEPEPGKTAFFVDVPKTAWYFRAAHVNRMYGVFKGSGNNDFHGADLLQAADAQRVVQRYGSAQLLAPEQQRDNPALPVLAKPSDVENLLQKDRLSSPEIAQAREQILALPPDMRGELFHRLASKSAYASQRDNAAKLAGTGDVMCNVTALAMVLESLGIDNPDQRRQFEDVLDEMRATGKMGARTDRNSRIPLAKKFGVSGKTVSYGAGRSAGAAKKWFQETVLPEMKEGAGVILSILMPPYGHIVRLQWVESEGLVVDDPYGRAGGGNVSKYDTNAKSGGAGAGAKGEDNHWDWQFVAEQANYVQFFVK